MSLILAVVISAPNIHNTTGHRLVTRAVSSPVAGIYHNVTLAVTCSPASAAAGGGSAIIEEAGGKRKGATVGRREDHRSAEWPLSHPGAVHAGRRRRERVRAAGHGGRRPLPPRPLQEQAVLRRQPPRGRLPGGHASRAPGGVLASTRPPLSAILFGRV